MGYWLRKYVKTWVIWPWVIYVDHIRRLGRIEPNNLSFSIAANFLAEAGVANKKKAGVWVNSRGRTLISRHRDNSLQDFQNSIWIRHLCIFLLSLSRRRRNIRCYHKNEGIITCFVPSSGDFKRPLRPRELTPVVPLDFSSPFDFWSNDLKYF